MRETVGKNSKFVNLINIPECDGVKWTDTREGGLNFYAVILQPQKMEDRFTKCLSGVPSWGLMESVLSPRKFQRINKKLYKFSEKVECGIQDITPEVPCNLSMLIGTTGTCPWDGNFYFCGRRKDLTPDGKKLFEMIKKTYGVYPTIVTLLDT